MISLIKDGAYLINGMLVSKEEAQQSDIFAKAGIPVQSLSPDADKKNTMAYRILENHNVSTDNKKADQLEIKFDALTSHDITYVGIVQTALASGLEKFPVPYILTNCHNSLGAVGGTINEDDHVFGLSAAKRFGGVYVPAHLAVIHQYMREMMAGCGKMILGSDSHTRYGALGTMAIGEGGPELVKQLLGRTYQVARPQVIAVYLTGKPKKGVGPQDVALSIIKEVFANGFVKNKVMEFVGPGIKNLSMDFRNGIDVMTTETTCLSSIWETDDITKDFLTVHNRKDDYAKLSPGEVAYYDGAIVVNLDTIVPMIAMPFHPSNAFSIADVNAHGKEILAEVEKNALAQLDVPGIELKLMDKYKDGKFHVNQGIIVGCSGGLYENLALAANILKGKNVGSDYFNFSVYPSSHPIYLSLLKSGALESLMEAGTVVRTAFCGPCFGAGDTPANTAFSIRHATRNFPNREGSKPGQGQISSVALMDARSIAATAANGGVLTAATDIDFDDTIAPYTFDEKPYESRVYPGFGKENKEDKLIYGPSIKDWPKIEALSKNMLVKLAAVITDAVTTTDELIPSGETSSYRSNPFALSEFTLSRKVPEYVGRAKAIHEVEKERLENSNATEVATLYKAIHNALGRTDSIEDFTKNTAYGSSIFANKPGDGSAREQAASCQRVLGASANIAIEYATKRYRSNVINWGMIPFLTDAETAAKFDVADYVFIPDVAQGITEGKTEFPAVLIHNEEATPITLSVGDLSSDEREIIVRGCLINYYAAQ